MVSSQHTVVVLLISISIPMAIGRNNAYADSLRADLPKDTFFLYEPVPIYVTVAFDDPVIVDLGSDREGADRHARQIPKRLNVVLRDEQGAQVSESWLLGASFVAPDPGQPTRVFSACGLACFEMLKLAKGHTWDINTGRYSITVLGSGLKSSPVFVEFVAPEGEEGEAAKVFLEILHHEGGLDFLFSSEHATDAIIPLYEKLERDYADTPFGRYASVSLALFRFETTVNENNNKGGKAIWGPVSDELTRVESTFPGKHLLHERVLLKLSIASVLAGEYNRARGFVHKLKDTYPDGRFAAQAAELEVELQQLESDQNGLELP